MRLNLDPLIERDIQQVVHVFSNLDWNQADYNYLTKKLL